MADWEAQQHPTRNHHWNYAGKEVLETRLCEGTSATPDSSDASAWPGLLATLASDHAPSETAPGHEKAALGRQHVKKEPHGAMKLRPCDSKR